LLTTASWRSAVDAGALDWRTAARAQVSAWVRRLAPLKAVASHSKPVTCEAFSPDGESLLTGREDGTGRLWDAAGGNPRGEPMPHPDAVLGAAFSADGKSVLTLTRRSARVWDAATGRPSGPPRDHPDYHGLIPVAPDGRTIVTWGTIRTGLRAIF